jgi:SAM-dependent methyltransferase
VDSQAWDRAYAAHDLTWPIAPHPALTNLSLPPARALELGCGEGRQSIWLAKNHWQVTAVDFSPVAVSRARRLADHHGTDVTFAVADVAEYTPPPVDLVLILYLHTDLTEILPSAASALAPGGTLVVQGWDAANPSGPPHGYTPEGLRAAVPGLEIERVTRVPQPGSPTAIDVLLVARSVPT